MATPQEIKAIANEMRSAMQSVLKMHESRLVDIMGKKEDRGSRRKKDDSPTASKNANQRLTSSIRNLNKHVESSGSLFAELNKELKEYIKQQNKNDKEDEKQSKEDNKRRNLEITLFRRTTNNLLQYNGAIVGAQEEQRRNNQETRNSTEELTGFRGILEETGKKLVQSFSALAGLKMLADNIQSSLSTSNTLNLETFTDSLTMAMNPQDLIAIQSQYRNDAMRIGGGTKAYTDQLRESQYDLLAYSKNLTEAAQSSAAIRSSIMNVGMSFDEASSIIGSGNNGLIGQFKQLSSITGQTITELNDRMRGLMENDDAQAILQKMTKTQRVDYLLSQGRLQRQLTLMTGNLDKSTEILRAQQQDGSKSFIERFRTVALQTAAASRVGIDPSRVNKMRELAMKNPANLTGTERKELIMIRDDLSQAVRNMEGSDVASTEILGNLLRDTLKVGELDAYNTELTKAMDPNAVANQASNSLSAQLDGNETLKQIYNVLSSLSTFTQNALPLLLIGLLGKGSMFAARKMFRGGPGAAGAPKMGMLDRTKNMLGYSTTHKMAGYNIRTKPKSLSGGLKMGPAAGGITGLAAMGVGMGLDYLWQPETESGQTTKNVASSALSGAGMGAMIGSFVPVIGTAVGAAVGGVIGSIVGFMEDTQTDEQRKIEKLKNTQVDNEMMLLNAKMSAAELEHLTTINQLEEQRQTAIDSNNNAEDIRLSKQIDNITTEHEARMGLLREQQSSIQKLSSAYGKLGDHLDKQRNINDGFSNAFETDWAGGGQVDLGELKDITGMTGQDLVTDILTTLGGDALSLDQVAALKEAMASGSEIEENSNRELYNILSNWREGRVQKDVEKTTALEKDATSERINIALDKLTRLSSEASNSTLAPLTNNSSISSLVSEMQNNGNQLTEQIVKGITLSAAEDKKADSNNDGTTTLIEKMTYLITMIEQSNRDRRRHETDKKQAAENQRQDNRDFSTKNQVVYAGQIPGRH